MVFKFLFPRKLYYGQWAGSGWIGLVFDKGYWTILSAGFGFWETIRHLKDY